MVIEDSTPILVIIYKKGHRVQTFLMMLQQKGTFVSWILGFLSSSHQCQIIAPEKHLHMANPPLHELWKKVTRNQKLYLSAF